MAAQRTTSSPPHSGGIIEVPQVEKWFVAKHFAAYDHRRNVSPPNEFGVYVAFGLVSIRTQEWTAVAEPLAHAKPREAAMSLVAIAGTYCATNYWLQQQ